MSGHIEPTDAQVAAFKEAWVSADVGHHFDKPGDRTRIGLRAALNVHEAPVPLLPTESYTVIRVAWDERHRDDWPSVLVLGVGHDWAWSPVGGPGLIDLNDLPKWITHFEVLSEPRALTAKAVLDRVEEFEGWTRTYEGIASEFGVQP